ncbi:iron-containing alcohol dehydrogenase [Kibdelosporangium persicum]|uniref:Iron-containing alcohol dehydrogenase n=1 Tax=Kibdelosporangium persicum TaxID=2698649 RepID=A0ABX2FAV1_9PSEU|nr:iron-containing alcohol dehydrogenase [Kibdelosporangium persicum]NRN68012.1 Iron-containing alcohol dehydrogenase [Kibdelosporangium persicum]
MHTDFEVSFAGRLRFGCGVVEDLPDAVAEVGGRTAFVVTDTGMRATGIIDRVSAILDKAGVRHEIFDQVGPNPGTDDIDAAAALVRRFGDAAVIPVGGGSSLDAAKGIALLAVNAGVARDFDYRNEPDNPGLPLVAVPTTAGTGAETNGFGVIEDRAAHRKVYIGHGSVQPRISILDPELTVGLPPRATAATGFDALVHGIESLASRGSNPISAAYATQAVGMVGHWLPQAVRDGKDIEARAQMILASHLAGLALSISGLGLVHGIAHSVTNHTGAVHGLALASVLAEVMEFSREQAATAYATVAHAMHQTDAVSACHDLAAEIGVTVTLSDLGCTPDMIDSIAMGALADAVTSNTPRMPSHAELTSLLKAAL